MNGLNFSYLFVPKYSTKTFSSRRRGSNPESLRHYIFILIKRLPLALLLFKGARYDLLIMKNNLPSHAINLISSWQCTNTHVASINSTNCCKWLLSCSASALQPWYRSKRFSPFQTTKKWLARIILRHSESTWTKSQESIHSISMKKAFSNW